MKKQYGLADDFSCQKGRMLAHSVFLLVVTAITGCWGGTEERSDFDQGIIPAVAERFPMVAVDDAGRALILSKGREMNDPQKPVHPFAATYEFATRSLSPGTDLAGATAQTFTSGGRDHAIAMDESGQGTAVWVANNGDSVELYANRFDRSAGWGQREQLSPSGATFIRPPHVAMDGFQRALAVWSQDGALLLQSFLPASGWVGARTQRANVGDVDVVYRSLFGYVVWEENRVLYASRFTGNTGNLVPGDPVEIGGTGSNIYVALHRQAPSESPIAVWEGPDGIYSNHLISGIGWQNEVKLPGSDGGSNPAIAMASNLEAVAVWEGGNNTIRASRFTGRVWLVPETLGAGKSPRVGTDASGNAIAVWSNGSTVQAARDVRGTGWEPERTIGSSLVANGQPEIAMDNSGRALAVWEAVDPPNSLTTKVEVYEFGGFDLALADVRPVALLGVNDQASATVTVTRSDYFGPVSFSPVIDCPANVTCTITPNSVQGAQTDVVVSFATGNTIVTPGNYVVTVQANGGGLTRTRLIELRIF